VTGQDERLHDVIGRISMPDAEFTPELQLPAGLPLWRQLLIGNGPHIRQICDIIQLIAPRRCTVLITGETGTGKEVVARAIHAAGNRAKLPMVALNCTALPASLVETELFGHAKGAFTGAHVSRAGRFEQAHRSSIFLDEIGDLPLEAQAKLLRVLQDQEFHRIGGSEIIRVDVRVIAASNVDLAQAVREGRFREDLFYRLNVVVIHLAPLRERPEDIPLLLEHFLDKVSLAEKMSAKRITAETAAYLQRLEWPGNIRQLEHAVHRAFALSGNRDLLTPEDFDWKPALRPQVVTAQSEQLVAVPESGLDFEQVVASFELSLLNQALVLSGGNKARAAELLRIKRTTLLAKLKSFEERRSVAVAAVSGVEHARKSSLGTVLIVERDLAVRKLIASALKEQNYRVLESGTVSTAIELLDCWKTHIRLVILSAAASSNAEADAFGQATDGLPVISICDRHSHAQSVARSVSDRNALLHRPFAPEDLVALANGLTEEPAMTMLRSEFCA
jgi:DNA-binding NtrC family response regulator